MLRVPPSRIRDDAEGVVDEFGRAVDVRQGWPRPPVLVLTAG
ncbi:MAG TPA: hypothetical protein VLV82_02265 [Candidatus Angelobacter sp.]|nr:hypothetical protein [Candidatus Angelobacter sp.]